METVNIHAAKTNLSKLVKRALNGEDIAIARNGEVLVHLTPHKEVAKNPREFGQWTGQVWFASDHNKTSPVLENEPVLTKKPRRGGQWTGKVWYAPDFDQTDAIIEKMFEESELFPKS